VTSVRIVYHSTPILAPPPPPQTPCPWLSGSLGLQHSRPKQHVRPSKHTCELRSTWRSTTPLLFCMHNLWSSACTSSCLFVYSPRRVFSNLSALVPSQLPLPWLFHMYFVLISDSVALATATYPGSRSAIPSYVLSSPRPWSSQRPQ